MTLASTAAADLLADIRALPARNTPAVRALRRRRSLAWRATPADFMIGVALEARSWDSHRWVLYELVRFHEGAFASLDDAMVAELAEGLNSWDGVDAFGRILTGAAWAHSLIGDGLVNAWSGSPDRWRRRLALVSTIGLNMPADGGSGDTIRTLTICRRLVADRDDMVEKALSWALRVLAVRDPGAVAGFLMEQEPQLAARVKREVRNKLSTGLKNPPRSGQAKARAEQPVKIDAEPS